MTVTGIVIEWTSSPVCLPIYTKGGKVVVQVFAVVDLTCTEAGLMPGPLMGGGPSNVASPNEPCRYFRNFRVDFKIA